MIKPAAVYDVTWAAPEQEGKDPRLLKSSGSGTTRAVHRRTLALASGKGTCAELLHNQR